MRQVRHVFSDNREAQAFICGVNWVNDSALEVIDVEVGDEFLVQSDHLDPLDEVPLYWSNDQGWVSEETADRYTNTSGNLPDGGHWMQRLTATVVVNDEDGDDDWTFDHRDHL